MSSRAERIAEAIASTTLNDSEVARRIGCKSQAVAQWRSGATKDLKSDNLFALADLTGFEARWIATGKGPKRKAETAEEARLLENYRHAGAERRDIIRRVAEPAPTYRTGEQ
jgi:transcriptional regulator with XRE-family HTH domain